MANTVTIHGKTISITGLDADFSLSATGSASGTELEHFKDTGLAVHSIRFHPSAANDIMVVHEGGIDNAVAFYAKCSGDTDDRIQYYEGQWMKPVIDITDCTLGTAANARIDINIM